MAPTWADGSFEGRTIVRRSGMPSFETVFRPTDDSRRGSLIGSSLPGGNTRVTRGTTESGGVTSRRIEFVGAEAMDRCTTTGADLSVCDIGAPSRAGSLPRAGVTRPNGNVPVRGFSVDVTDRCTIAVGAPSICVVGALLSAASRFCAGATRANGSIAAEGSPVDAGTRCAMSCDCTVAWETRALAGTISPDCAGGTRPGASVAGSAVERDDCSAIEGAGIAARTIDSAGALVGPALRPEIGADSGARADGA
jgi:hypothetical protein